MVYYEENTKRLEIPAGLGKSAGGGKEYKGGKNINIDGDVINCTIDTDDYARKSDLEEFVQETELEDYAKKTDIEGFATEQDITTKIEEQKFKTINGQTIKGDGNIVVGGGSEPIYGGIDCKKPRMVQIHTGSNAPGGRVGVKLEFILKRPQQDMDWNLITLLGFWNKEKTDTSGYNRMLLDQEGVTIVMGNHVKLKEGIIFPTDTLITVYLTYDYKNERYEMDVFYTKEDGSEFHQSFGFRYRDSLFEADKDYLFAIGYEIYIEDTYYKAKQMIESPWVHNMEIHKVIIMSGFYYDDDFNAFEYFGKREFSNNVYTDIYYFIGKQIGNTVTLYDRYNGVEYL